MASVEVANRDRSPLTRDQLEATVPSIFAEAPHDSRSARYLYVPTIDMLDALGREGFSPVWASQARPRDPSRREYAKHMVRLAHANSDRGRILADLRASHPGAHRFVDQSDSPVFPEIVLTNSHDGTSSVQLSAGLFRYACTNGLIVSAGDAGTWRYQHSAKWRDDIIEGSYRVLDAMGEVTERVGEMQSRELAEPERLLLAEHAMALRWGDDRPPIQPAAMLRPHRAADRGADAFSTLNVLQENTIRGGLAYTYRDANGRHPQYRHTRSVTGIDDLGRINRGLWDAVASLTTGNRVDLAAEMFGRLTPAERAQMAERFA